MTESTDASTGAAADPDQVTDEQGRLEPPVAAGDTDTLIGFLEYQRATFAWKCIGPGSADLNKTVAASTMTLGGLLKHLTYVEDQWFHQRVGGQRPYAPWDTVDWSADVDWDWHSAATQSPAELRTSWEEAVVRSRAALDQALQVGDLDQLTRFSWRDGRTPNLRWILCHMIEEYARHNGHADLLREAVDGSTGE